MVVSRQDHDSRKNTVAEITRRALSRGQWPQVINTPLTSLLACVFIVHHNGTSDQLDGILKVYRNGVSPQVYDWVKKGRIWCPEGALL